MTLSTLVHIIVPCTHLMPGRARKCGATPPGAPSIPHRQSLMKWSTSAHRLTQCTPLTQSRVKTCGATPPEMLLIPLQPLQMASSIWLRTILTCTHSQVTGYGAILLTEACNPRHPLPNTLFIFALTI